MHRGLVLCFTMTFIATSVCDEFPDINELFGVSNFTSGRKSFPVSSKKLKNSLLDLEHIDMDQFNSNLDKLMRDHKYMKENLTLMARRADKQDTHYVTARKILDSMLTLLYMTRHKLRSYESTVATCKSVSCRIGYVYNKLREIKAHMQSLYTFIYRQTYKQHGEMAGPVLRSHSRMVMLHTDFTYIWWVLVRLHDNHCHRYHVFMTKPTTASGN